MVAEKAKNISPFIVMEVLEKAHSMERKGVDVIHLEVGEPDFDTPECVKDAISGALENGHTHYTHSLGLPELRQSICDHYKKVYKVVVDPGHVLVTSGTSPAMFLLFSALLEIGDQVILADPHYACYPNFIRFLGAEPVFVPVREEDGFQLRAEEIKNKITKLTKAVIINSPSNPTGNLLSPQRMKEIAGLGLFVISDEIYHGLVYEGKEHSILEFTENAFVLNGFSKLYAMTGLRLGYLIAPPSFIRPMQKIQQNFFISANSAVQHGGIAALTRSGPEVEKMKKIYNDRRIYMINRLKAMGFGISVEPTGAFYIFANASHIQKDSFKLAFEILEKAHVGVAPGIDFGECGQGYLRFSYANSMENIIKGLDRVENYISER